MHFLAGPIATGLFIYVWVIIGTICGARLEVIFAIRERALFESLSGLAIGYCIHFAIPVMIEFKLSKSDWTSHPVDNLYNNT